MVLEAWSEISSRTQALCLRWDSTSFISSSRSEARSSRTPRSALRVMRKGAHSATGLAREQAVHEQADHVLHQGVVVPLLDGQGDEAAQLFGQSDDGVAGLAAFAPAALSRTASAGSGPAAAADRRGPPPDGAEHRVEVVLEHILHVLIERGRSIRHALPVCRPRATWAALHQEAACTESCTISCTRRPISASCWWGVIPRRRGPCGPGRRSNCRPPTRTMKNSSRLEDTMARNLRRSSSGLPASRASSSTRQLNSIQLSSRLKKTGCECQTSGAIPSLLLSVRNTPCSP
jgi:hypothetical protein